MPGAISRKAFRSPTSIFAHGILAGYAAILLDSLLLGSRERGPKLRYKDVPAVKLGQLGVHHAFQGSGLGSYIVAYVIEVARRISRQAGCRYVTVDARPGIVRWYEGMGFEFNKEHQKLRLRDAERQGRDLAMLAVSMRFDIREAWSRRCPPECAQPMARQTSSSPSAQSRESA